MVLRRFCFCVKSLGFEIWRGAEGVVVILFSYVCLGWRRGKVERETKTVKSTEEMKKRRRGGGKRGEINK